MKLFPLIILSVLVVLIINIAVILIGVENDVIVNSIRALTIIGSGIFVQQVYWKKRKK